MRSSDGAERVFHMGSAKLVIGRLSGCDVQVALPSIAERHCEINVTDEALTLTDLGSDLGTLHNGHRIERTTLRPGDRVSVGPIEFTVRQNSVHRTPPDHTTLDVRAGSAEVVVVRQTSPKAEA
jgi:pSer/pThr/pTyr-binding forkhead associated (FHA) protein